MSEFLIIVDHGIEKNFPKVRKLVELKSNFWRSTLFKNRIGFIFHELCLGLKCWWVSIRHKGHQPLIGAGSGPGFIFAFMQYIGRPVFKRRTHFMVDFLLEKKRTGWGGLIDTFKMHIFRTVVDCAVVWGKTDVDTFAREYDLPKEKLKFHPFHITLETYKFEPKDDGYIFAGGNGGRDYQTLINAVKNINYPVFIATTLPGIKELADGYDHITVQAVTPDDFRTKMAGCSIFVECHDPGFFRTAGHQTFLNAMWMGKPVVMADKRSAVGYMEHGVDSLLVEVGDAEALETELKSLVGDKELARRLSKTAQEKVSQPQYRTSNTMQSIYNIALEYNHLRWNLGGDVPTINLY